MFTYLTKTLTFLKVCHRLFRTYRSSGTSTLGVELRPETNSVTIICTAIGKRLVETWVLPEWIFMEARGTRLRLRFVNIFRLKKLREQRAIKLEQLSKDIYKFKGMS